MRGCVPPHMKPPSPRKAGTRASRDQEGPKDPRQGWEENVCKCPMPHPQPARASKGRGARSAPKGAGLWGHPVHGRRGSAGPEVRRLLSNVLISGNNFSRGSTYQTIS